jgi:hypothetical protein
MKTEATTRDRRADRTENAVFGVLAAAIMGASPFVAFAAGRWADATLSRAAKAQRAVLRQVPATMLQTAPKGQYSARAQWQGPGGLLRAGRISVPAGAQAGNRVRVWINQAGEVAEPPMQQEEIANRVVLAQTLAAVGFSGGLGGLGWLILQSVERRRLDG